MSTQEKRENRITNAGVGGGGERRNVSFSFVETKTMKDGWRKNEISIERDFEKKAMSRLAFQESGTLFPRINGNGGGGGGGGGGGSLYISHTLSLPAFGIFQPSNTFPPHQFASCRHSPPGSSFQQKSCFASPSLQLVLEGGGGGELRVTLETCACTSAHT